MRFVLLVLLVMSCFLGNTVPESPPIGARPPTAEETRVWAVTSQSIRFGVDPAFALRLSRRENESASPTVWSSTGCCTGIMQVNIDHLADYWAVCVNPVTQVGLYADSVVVMQGNRVNACYGVRIWLDKLARCSNDRRCALQFYVGASRPENIPRGYVEAILDDQ